MILITGGAGFIGLNFALEWFKHSDEPLINLDSLSYASNVNNLSLLETNDAYTFIHGDIRDSVLVSELLKSKRPRAIINFAAESHVDRSIAIPDIFLDTNVIGTYRLLECARTFFESLPEHEQHTFRFLQISTDEVYGSLSAEDPLFSETSPARPSSPYAASKASADAWVNAYHRTYGLPTLITRCSNNYGSYQFPEKLIPRMIACALNEDPLPLYGSGEQIRDWIYVHDHCNALRIILEKAKPGAIYNIGSNNEASNIYIVSTLCDLLDKMAPRSQGASYRSLISFVADRPGHDFRYATDSSKIHQEFGWHPTTPLSVGLPKTVHWYLQYLHLKGRNRK